jgi:hypothetical protein
MKVDELIDYATAFIGEQEKPGNSGFKNKTFEDLMKSVGWKKGQSWCAFFCKLVYKDFITEEKFNLFSPAALSTLHNFYQDNEKCKTMEAKRGNMAVWGLYDNGVLSWKGHIGIVAGIIGSNTFQCIEGNSNKYGGSEGKEVCLVNRSLLVTEKKNGLVLQGFIDPFI